jgi:hypothetical protein
VDHKIINYLRPLGGALEKYIPDEVKFAAPEDIDSFLNWFIKGDGRTYNGARIAYTNSKQLADDLQECFIKSGTHANITTRDRRGTKRYIVDHWVEVKNLSYVVYERRQKAESYIRRSMDWHKIPYSGKVYCVEVPEHNILLVRRDDKPYFCGNTLPILEAMACGTPVMTRNVGHVSDLYSEDGQNMYINEYEHDDVEGLKKNLKMLMDNVLLRKKMREKGWDTVKNWGTKRMAWKFEKAYWDVIRRGDNKPVVSIIMPVRNDYKVLAESLPRAIAQDYPYKEMVVVDSSDAKIDFAKMLELIDVDDLPPMKYIPFEAGEDEYSLAKARNLGVLNASGQLLVFCDARIGMEGNAVSEFVKHWSPNHWLWGMKDDTKKGFVENFSCIARDELVYNGMFNQTICSQYGCMTQELRERLSYRPWAPVTFQFVNAARAKGVGRASPKRSRREDIRESKDKLFKLYQV